MQLGHCELKWEFTTSQQSEGWNCPTPNADKDFGLKELSYIADGIQNAIAS